MLSGVSEEQIRTAIEIFTSNSSDRNIDRVYDELSSNEIETIFKSIEKIKESGLKDCFGDESSRISKEQEATKLVLEEVRSQEESNRKENIVNEGEEYGK